MLDFENAVKLQDHDERKKEIISRLKDYEDKDLLCLFQEANSYDGSFDFCWAFDMEDIGEFVSTEDAYNFLCRIVYGDVNMSDDMLRFNAYGNLESVNRWDLEEECKDNIPELAEWLLDYYHEVYSLYEEDEELLKAWEYGYEEEDEDE